MHYYKRNLGDYAKKAGRLSMLQHGAYTLLIDACYDREQFPTLDEAIDWTWASSTAEIEAVEFVLRKFFVLEDGRYVQKRIQTEISDYQAKAETNARIAQEREAKRKGGETNRARLVNESSPNQEPLTNNQEKDITPTQKAKRPKKAKPEQTQLSEDFCVSGKVRAWAEEKGHHRLDEHLESFKAKCKAKAYTYADWDSAFMEAIRANWAKLENLPTGGPESPSQDWRTSWAAAKAKGAEVGLVATDEDDRNRRPFINRVEQKLNELGVTA